MRKVTKAAAAAMVLLAGAARAEAADILPPAYQLESDPMVEFGSGWYLRGDLGYSALSVPLGSAPVVVTNNSTGRTSYDAAQSGVQNGRTTNASLLNATVGVGFQFNRWFRMDATYEWRDRASVSARTSNALCDGGTATCGVTDTAQIQSWSGLVNAYGDLGTWASLTPYIGAGIGFTSINAAATETYYTSSGGAYVNNQTFGGNTYHYGYVNSTGLRQTPTNFTFALMAGFAYDLAPHLKLDIGYRYLNMGAINVAESSGNIAHKTLDSQEVRAGLRWTPDL